MALQRPEILSVRKSHADEIRLWAKHFAPINDHDVVVDIPQNWYGFFTKSLQSPDNFL
jgi:hypothetical protein